MSYLDQYDQISHENPKKQLALINRWIRGDWQPFFAELREHRPIFHVPRITLVTKAVDIQEVLSRHNDFSVRIYAARMDEVVGPFMLGRDSTSLNWSEKSIMRSMLSIEDLPRIRGLVGQLTDETLNKQDRNEIEAVSTLGRHIPYRFCADYFGFPGPDEATMLSWSKATQNNIFKNVMGNPDVHKAAVKAGDEMRTYIASLLNDYRSGRLPKTQPNIVARLLEMSLPEETVFNEEQLITNICGLLVGLVETSSQAIVQVLQQILNQPPLLSEAKRLAEKDDHSKFDALVWEALRFNPINPLLFRYVEKDSIIAKGTDREAILTAGTICFACTASAMHDPDRVENPNEFDTSRPDNAYMHFGHGHHECLGKYIVGQLVPEVIRRVLLRSGAGSVDSDREIDFGGGYFPERYMVTI